MTCRRAVYVLGVRRSKVKVTTTQNRKTGSRDFSVIFHPIVMKLGWCIDISKCSIHLHLQGHRSKVKVTRRQSLKIGPTCVTRFLWRFFVRSVSNLVYQLIMTGRRAVCILRCVRSKIKVTRTHNIKCLFSNFKSVVYHFLCYFSTNLCKTWLVYRQCLVH